MAGASGPERLRADAPQVEVGEVPGGAVPGLLAPERVDVVRCEECHGAPGRPARVRVAGPEVALDLGRHRGDRGGPAAPRGRHPSLTPGVGRRLRDRRGRGKAVAPLAPTHLPAPPNQVDHRHYSRSHFSSPSAARSISRAIDGLGVQRPPRPTKRLLASTMVASLVLGSPTTSPTTMSTSAAF